MTESESLVYFLEKLVSIPSTSCDEREKEDGNQKLLAFISETLVPLGFKLTFIGDDPKWQNLLAIRGDSKYLLSGHTDTVPCNLDKWESNPYQLSVKEDKAFGLGACDMKAFLAVMLTLAKHTNFDLALLFTAQEETSMQGAIECQKALAGKFDFKLIIIGEPTENTLVTSHKGWMYGKLEIEGKSAHSSNPSLGVNAIEQVAKALELLIKLKDNLSLRDPNNPPTLNLGQIIGGDCANRVCSHVSLIFDVRPTEKVGVSQVLKELMHIEEKLVAQKIKAKFSYPYPFIEPMATKISDEDKALLEKLTSKLSESVSYCTEGSLLQDLGPCVILGPGSIAQAHQENEYVSLKSLEDHFKLIKEFLSLKLAGGGN